MLSVIFIYYDCFLLSRDKQSFLSSFLPFFHLGIPTKCSIIWGSPESAASSEDPKKVQRHSGIPRKHSAICRLARFWGIPRKRCAICRLAHFLGIPRKHCVICRKRKFLESVEHIYSVLELDARYEWQSVPPNMDRNLFPTSHLCVLTHII